MTIPAFDDFSSTGRAPSLQSAGAQASDREGDPMATGSRIRVGLVGANPKRGFAAIAHIPALGALPQFEISAVCTSRQETADAAAAELGARHAFADAAALARHPDVDLVTVCVRAPDHYADGDEIDVGM